MITTTIHRTRGRRRWTRAAALGATGALALGLGACGSSDDDKGASPSGGGGSQTAAGGFNAALPSDDQAKGGKLKLLSAEGFQHLDPGQSYFQLDYMTAYAAHRGLYYYNPGNSEKAIPDLAEGPPEVSADGKTVTVKIKSGIKYGTVKKTPIDGQEVKAADIKYAFERALNPSVPNGYFAAYFTSIVGSKNAKGKPISGITTPDDHTIVFKLDQPFGATVANALVMPITIPMPKSYVGQFDAKNPNPYETHPEIQAFTGPYMIASYQEGRTLKLVRNPRWDASTDSRPAYLDEIDWVLNADENVSGRQIFNGTNLANGDTPAPASVRDFATKAKDRISFSPLGNRWISLNTQRKPFSDLNIRKAVSAAIDRRAMQLTRGGALTGDVATHFIPPGVPGFEEAGGTKGPGADYLANPEGDAALAADYMKKAGFADGKYKGGPITMFSSADSPGKESAQVWRRALESLGFKVRQKSVDQSAFYDACNSLAQQKKIDTCMNMGWLPDFFDGLAMLNANFNGDALSSVNQNPSLQDDPKINAAMNDAAKIADLEDRAAAWGNVDKMLVENAVAIPWYWDKQANIVSKNVHGVIAKWNAAWDLSYMSIDK
jgi:peptide/nickel transport system substrate-binding protein